MKKIIMMAVSAVFFIMTSVFADESSTQIPEPTPIVSGPESAFYLNVNLGGGQFDVDVAPNLGQISVDNGGFIWSANIGYQFTPYIALEVGYMRLPEYEISGTATFVVSGVPVALTANQKVNVNAWLLAMKGMWPVSNEVNIFAKAGLAYQTTSGRESLSVARTNIVLDSLGTTGDSDQVAPYFALGVEYMVFLNWYLNVQGIVIPAVANFPTSWGVLTGVSYMFG